MLTQINGLHHVTSLARDAKQNNAFFTERLGLRRVKKTVNFDRPDIYHLYYGDTTGSPGTVMTYFPSAERERRKPGTGEVAQTTFSVPAGAIGYWRQRLSEFGTDGLKEEFLFDEKRLLFCGPDGECFALVEVENNPRLGWTAQQVSADVALRGFHSVSLRLNEDRVTAELLTFMGYQKVKTEGRVTRFSIPDGNGAHLVDLETRPDFEPAVQGAGSVHHIAFSVDDRRKQLEVREALTDAGHQVTPVIDRDYFWAIYFRSAGGILFEIATNEPGFDRDEDITQLGEALKLPTQHEHLRAGLELSLPEI